MNDEIANLRCADEDRQLVLDVLSRAFADGRITSEEHEERMERAAKARFFKDLDPLTSDLVAAPPRSTHSQTPAETHSAAVQNQERLVDRSVFLGTLRMPRPATVPQQLDLLLGAGTGYLDMAGATFEASRIQLHIRAYLSYLYIRVPKGVVVRSQLDSNFMSDVSINGIVPTGKDIVLGLDGVLFASNVKILGPDCSPRKYRRFIK